MASRAVAMAVMTEARTVDVEQEGLVEGVSLSPLAISQVVVVSCGGGVVVSARGGGVTVSDSRGEVVIV